MNLLSGSLPVEGSNSLCIIRAGKTSNCFYSTAEHSTNPSSLGSDLPPATTSSPMGGISSTRISVENTPCPILAIGLGIGVPLGFIIIFLVIAIIILCVEIRSLRKYKGEMQNNTQNHTTDPKAAGVTVQPSLNQYEQLKRQNSQQEYERIDRHDAISTAGVEITDYYETPSS